MKTNITDKIKVHCKEDSEGFSEWYLIDDETGDEFHLWSDVAVVDYPEDLCWNRDISDLFYKAFEIGYNLGKEEK